MDRKHGDALLHRQFGEDGPGHLRIQILQPDADAGMEMPGDRSMAALHLPDQCGGPQLVALDMGKQRPLGGVIGLGVDDNVEGSLAELPVPAVERVGVAIEAAAGHRVEETGMKLLVVLLACSSAVDGEVLPVVRPHLLPPSAIHAPAKGPAAVEDPIEGLHVRIDGMTAEAQHMPVQDSAGGIKTDVRRRDAFVDGFQKAAVPHGALGIAVGDKPALIVLQPDKFADMALGLRQHDVGKMICGPEGTLPARRMTTLHLVVLDKKARLDKRIDRLDDAVVAVSGSVVAAGGSVECFAARIGDASARVRPCGQRSVEHDRRHRLLAATAAAGRKVKHIGQRRIVRLPMEAERLVPTFEAKVLVLPAFVNKFGLRGSLGLLSGRDISRPARHPLLCGVFTMAAHMFNIIEQPLKSRVGFQPCDRGFFDADRHPGLGQGVVVSKAAIRMAACRITPTRPSRRPRW